MAAYIQIVLQQFNEIGDEGFVEIEDESGKSLNIGRSYIDEKGFRRISINPEDIQNA